MRKKIFQKHQIVSYITYTVLMIVLAVIMGITRNSQYRRAVDTYSQVLSPYGYEYVSSYRNLSALRFEIRESSDLISAIDIGFDYDVGDYIVREYRLTFENYYEEKIYEIVDSLHQPYDIREYRDEIANAVEHWRAIDGHLSITFSSGKNISIYNRGETYTIKIVFSYR